MNETIRMAMEVMRLSRLEREGLIMPFEKVQLEEARKHMIECAQKVQMKVSDPFGLLNEADK